ncbi:MAG TPA: hypothetical protein VIY29_09140 [Ktedonobacteraceae bacterium]
MIPILVTDQAPVPLPSYHRAQGQRERWLHINALTLIETLQLLALYRLAVQLAHRVVRSLCPNEQAIASFGLPNPRTMQWDTLDQSVVLVRRGVKVPIVKILQCFSTCFT